MGTHVHDYAMYNASVEDELECKHKQGGKKKDRSYCCYSYYRFWFPDRKCVEKNCPDTWSAHIFLMLNNFGELDQTYLNYQASQNDSCIWPLWYSFMQSMTRAWVYTRHLEAADIHIWEFPCHPVAMVWYYDDTFHGFGYLDQNLDYYCSL